jgi:hypothetical protein
MPVPRADLEVTPAVVDGTLTVTADEEVLLEAVTGDEKESKRIWVLETFGVHRSGVVWLQNNRFVS